MSENELVAKPKEIGDWAGAGIGDSIASLVEDLNKSEWDAFALGVDGVAVGLDLLGMVLNPLGELVKAGVGWLMEHIEFIREPLEVLTGDPKQIEALSQTWANIATELNKAAKQYGDALKTVASWKGDAAEAYYGTATGYVEGLRGVAKYAGHASQGIAVAGIVVATERAIIFDLIASFISRVITEVLIAAASSFVTLGGSIGVFIASVTADACILAGRLSKRLAALLKVVEQFVRRFKSLGQTGRKVANDIMHKANKIRREADRGIRNSKFNDSMGTKIAKEGAKSTKDFGAAAMGDDS